MVNHGEQLTDRDDLLVAVPPLLIVAGNLTTKGGNRFIFAPYRLTLHHYAILHHLSGCSCKMMDLREVMFNSAANITQHVDALEERGWVRRVPSPEDRRSTLVELTDKGRNQLEVVDRHYLEQMRGYLKDVDTDLLKLVAEFLEQFIEHTVGMLENDDSPTAGKSSVTPSDE